MTYAPVRLAGFTLPELITCLVITTLLILVAVPAFSVYLQERRAREAIVELNQGFSLARSEAIKRRSIVTICGLGSSSACSKDWSKNVMIFEDVNGDRSLSPQDEMLHQISTPATGFFKVLVSNRNHFQYGATGTARNTMGSVIFCPRKPPANNSYYKLVVHLAGRTRIDHITGRGRCPN